MKIHGRMTDRNLNTARQLAENAVKERVPEREIDPRSMLLLRIGY